MFNLVIILLELLLGVVRTRWRLFKALGIRIILSFIFTMYFKSHVNFNMVFTRGMISVTSRISWRDRKAISCKMDLHESDINGTIILVTAC